MPAWLIPAVWFGVGLGLSALAAAILVLLVHPPRPRQTPLEPGH